MPSKDMKKAYEISGKAIREKIKKDIPQDEKYLEKVQNSDVIVVRGGYDRAEDVLGAMEIPHVIIDTHDADRAEFNPSQVVFINCPGNLTGDVSGATVTTTGDVTVGGNLSVDGQATQLGIVPVTSNATKVGIGRAPTTYALEVAGDIYFTGDNIIGGDAALDGFVVQKAVAGINFDVRSSTNTVELRVDASGNLGVKKSPGSFALDVSGNSNIDGDLTIAVTDAINNVGGTLNCRDITLTDPVTNQTTTLSATTAGSGSGVSRAKMFFHAYSS